jgi:glycerol-3-phosphate dehydrogenase
MEGRKKDTQVAIIGGGIAGTAIARELSKYKVKACLLEKEPSPGYGITKGSMSLVHGGIAYLSSRIIKRSESDLSLREFLSQPMNIKERLGEIGRNMFLELGQFLDIPVLQIGRVMVAKNQEEIETYKVIKDIAEEVNGTEGLEILDRDSLKAKEPRINPKFVGGIYDPSEMVIFAPDWPIAFAENAKSNGVDIILDTEVQAIEHDKGGYLIKTNKGKIKTEFLVNAAGIFADKIASMIGQSDFSMVFYRCEMLVLENKNYISHVVARLSEPGRPRMLLPTAHGDILVVHSMTPSIDKYDLNTTKEGLETISEIPQNLIPDISLNRDMKASFAGQLVFNSKNMPDYLLEFKEKNFLNVALAAPGLGPAPALAIEVVEMLAKAGLELAEKSDFNPYRFKQPRFFDLSTDEKNTKIQQYPKHGHIVCRCEHVSEQEIIDAVACGAKTLDDVKFRSRCGMGRCQGGFCTSRVIQIMAKELNVSPLEICKKSKGSYILNCETKGLHKEEQ